jgi:ketosteroid isomerase-like protein
VASPDRTIAAYRAAAENSDADAVAPLLAPDVAFHSPMTDRVPFGGRAEVTELHRDIFAVVDGLQTTEPLARDNLRSFGFSAQVRGVELNAQVVASVNTEGRSTTSQSS